MTTNILINIVIFIWLFMLTILIFDMMNETDKMQKIFEKHNSINSIIFNKMLDIVNKAEEMFKKMEDDCR